MARSEGISVSVILLPLCDSMDSSAHVNHKHFALPVEVRSAVCLSV